MNMDEHGWTCLENRGWKKPSYFAGSTASHKTTTSKVSNNINHRSFLWMGKQVFEFYLGVSHYIFGSLYWYMGVPVCEPTLQKLCRFFFFQGGSLRNWLVIILTLPTYMDMWDINLLVSGVSRFNPPPLYHLIPGLYFIFHHCNHCNPLIFVESGALSHRLVIKQYTYIYI